MSLATQNSNELTARIGAVRRRLFSVGILAATGWVLLVIIAVLLIAVWFDLLWELPVNARLGSFVVAGAAGLVLFWVLVGSLLRKSSQRWLAGRLDLVGATGGEITSGLELVDALSRSGHSQINTSASVPRTTAAGANSEIQKGLSAIAVNRAAATASQIDHALAIPSRPIKLIASILFGIGLLIAILGFSMPNLAKTQWSRFVSPSSDVPPFSMIEFDITPGDVEIRYGEALDIVAKLDSMPVDELQLILVGETEEVVPMFAEGNNQWRATLFRITQPLEYQVRSGRARSKKYNVEVIFVPEITDVQFRVTPPAYTRLGESVVAASDGVSGLPGTRVKVIATSNRPLSLGRLSLSHGDQSRLVELRPNADQVAEVVGEFEIKQSGKFEIQLVDEDGIESSQLVSSSVTMLNDDKPFVRLSNPKQNSWATATVQLPITIDVEDDFGISNLSLFRSLNDTRPLPMRIEVPEGVIRWDFRSFLPLSLYDLQPGDKLELFARVEDNDPRSTKGSESPVHTIHIISRDQFERMNQQQMGLESVLAKYRQIQRRLEGLEAMQREIEAMDADPNQPKDTKGKPSQAQAEKLVAAAAEFKKSAIEMQRLLDRKFPIDFDKDLETRIEEMSGKMFEISREVRNLIEKVNDGDVDNEQLKQRLKKLRERLEGIRKEFNQQVMNPLGKLAKIFPLMSKQQAFVQVMMRQQNLAERLRSLDGDDVDVEAETKRRMRELADEQGSLREMLDELLFEIENEAYSLPADEEFNELRDSALKFAADVAESGAMAEQQDAETGLAEFSGSRGYKHALEAANILKKFVDRSNETSQAGENAANQIFDPKFGRPKLGNSMKQLMDLFGPKNGQQQGGQNNRGLYGDQPSDQRSGSGENQSRSGGGNSRGASAEPGPGGEVNRTGGSTGSSQVTIPLRYERKVGDYYRLIVEELGDDK